MINVPWSFWELIPRTKQSWKTVLKLGYRSHEKQQPLEGHTAFLCAQHLGGTISNCCCLQGITVAFFTCGCFCLWYCLFPFLPSFVLLSAFMVSFLWALWYCLSIQFSMSGNGKCHFYIFRISFIFVFWNPLQEHLPSWTSLLHAQASTSSV